MKVDIKALIAKLTTESLHVKKWTISDVTVTTGAQGNYYPLSNANLPSSAQIKAVALASTPVDGWITGTAQIIDVRCYIGLYNHYSTSLTGSLGVYVFYTL